MNRKKWVCSKWNLSPTNEEKWEVTDEDCTDYCARNVTGSIRTLPKSDYRECEPPERWRDVTSEVVAASDCRNDSENGCCILRHFTNNSLVTSANGYRLRKVQLYEARGPIDNGDLSDSDYCPRSAFVVEKREGV